MQVSLRRAEVAWPRPHAGGDAQLVVDFDLGNARCEATTFPGGVWNQSLWRQLVAEADALMDEAVAKNPDDRPASGNL